MNDLGNFQNIFFKQTQGIRIGQHQRRRRFIGHRPQGFHIDIALCVAWNLLHRKAGHNRAGRIGSMSRIRNEHNCPLIFMMTF